MVENQNWSTNLNTPTISNLKKQLINYIGRNTPSLKSGYTIHPKKNFHFVTFLRRPKMFDLCTKWNMKAVTFLGKATFWFRLHALKCEAV